MTKEVAGNFNEVRKDFSDTRRDNSKFAERKAAEFSNENIKEIISRVMDDFGKFLEEKKDDITETASSYTNKYAGKIRSTIKENPIYSIAGAAALGVLVAAFCKRS